MSSVLTIPKGITHGDELVIIRRKEYEQLRKHFAEIKDALAKIRQKIWYTDNTFKSTFGWRVYEYTPARGG